ncbi:phage tail tape measure protein [Streptomyces tanashiensis]|uniref:phage tail tape measure protein n=1 Tax=Streptomyces tanashiensis TaxID=67367 RepID=UPI0033ED022E
MSDQAEHAGEEVGESLGEGIVRGADGRLRNARGRFVRAGTAAGAAVGDALASEAADGADEAVEETGSRLEKLKLVAAAAGVAAGAVLMAGFAQAMEQSQITGRLGAQLGATAPEAQRYGHIAGRMYADAVTEDFQSAADAISATMRAGIAPPGATEAQLQSLSTKVSDLASTFELDLGQTANAVGQAIKSGLAKDGVEALDVFTRGMQVMGPRADDLMDTFNEYGTIFRQTGIDARTATGLLSQGMKAGARDTDVIADSIKEFVLITQGGGEEVDAAFKKIGLSGSAMQKAFVQGGPAARAALDQVFDRLRAVKDPTDRASVALTLFGTKAEDTQKSLFALDPSKAAAALGTVGGAADKMGNSLRDNAGVRVEAFKRQTMQGLVDILGTRVIPALEKAFGFVREHSTAFTIAAGVTTGVLIPALTLLAVTSTVRMATVAWAWMMSGAASIRAAATHVSSAMASATAWTAMAARAVAAWTMMAARSVASAAVVAASWVGTALRGMVVFAAQIVRTAAIAVAQFTLMAARAIAWAAVMAAQWLIAMGPVGWVIAAVVGLVALIVLNWDKIKKYTGLAWDWIWSKIQDRVHAVIAVIQWLGRLPKMIGDFFSRAKDAAIRKMAEMVIWLRGLPGRIGAAVGNLKALLIDKGRNVVQGLWDGISAMGGWIKSKIMGWAKSVIPGPIADALGIHSPSKVTAAQGRWIARGLVVGMTAGMSQIKATANKMADIILDATTVKLTPKVKGGSKKLNRAIEERNRQLVKGAGAQRSKALKILNAGTDSLMRLASREEQVAARLKTATTRLNDLVKARAELVGNVRQGVLDAANITQGGEGGTTATSIWANLNQQLVKAKQFAAQLAALKKRGVRADLIAQIAQAGVEQGSAAAAALATASSGQIKQINSTQDQLVKAATQAGNTAGDAMYGGGIRAAQGLVKGLQTQQSVIERAMLLIAKGMERALKKALGIRSPSRVMAAVGQYIPAGLVRGIESGRSAVDASMASLVTPPTPAMTGPGAYGGTGTASYGRTGQPIVIEFKSSGTPRGDYLVQELRQAVKDRGGDVQVVLGQRR